jgi:TRAP-type C4-dicarboxylate transport system permease small subunit
VRLILYMIFLSIFALIVLDDDANWLEKTANFVTAIAIGLGARFLSKPHL